MTEHLTEQAIDRYRRRAASPSDHQTIAAHLAACDECLKRVANEEHSVAAFNALTEAFLPGVDEEPFHLSARELKNYAAGASAKADLVICQSHLDVCEQCGEELRLLSATRLRAGSKGRPPSAERFPWLGQGRSSIIPARVAAAVALLAMLGLVLLLWQKQSALDQPARPDRPQTPVASLSPAPSNEATPKPAEPGSPNPGLVLLKDGGQEIRTGPHGELTGLEGLDESARKMVTSALAGETPAKPKVLEDLSSPRLKLLGALPSENVFALTSPLRNVISAERPTLRWRALSGATSYVVSVYDEKFNRIAASPALTTTTWTLTQALPRGGRYSWEVTAVKDGKEITAPVAPAPRAQFKILEAEKLSTLGELKQRKPTSHLALGLMYARFGLVSEAEGEFQQLVKENPDSALARKLLRTVQAWRN